MIHPARALLAALRAALLLPFLSACSIHSNATAPSASAVLTPSLLRCEYLTNPLGINETSPRLSWILSSTRRADRQSAYQLLVASSPDLLSQNHADLWDSGKVASDENAHVVYAGKPLASRTACFWKVRVWSPLDPAATPAWSAPALFTVGLLSPSDWHAHWIDSSAAINTLTPTPPIHVLHAAFTSTKGPESLDVTDRLAAIANTGDVGIMVNADSMGGDPSPNIPKRLTITYEQNGKTTTQTIAENKGLSISNRPTRLWSLRKSFSTTQPISRATLYVTALGLYELHLNGHRVGDHALAPDWTDYTKRIRYQTYDVTPLINSGKNALAATLANGWYAGHLGNGGFQQYGKIPALLAQLEITYTDGTTATIATDDSWKNHPSPILASDFMLGESYDAREQRPDEDQPAFDDSSWPAATIRAEKSVPLDSQISPPVRETQLLHPIALTEPAPGHYTFDLGQNMVGVVRLKISANAGTTLTLRHAEMLNPDGTIYTANLRRAPSTDTYICSGNGTEIFQPHFTFHGFRYVELTGLPTKPTKDAITGVVLGTDTPLTGSFSCSDPRINQLVSNIQWGQRGNYLSVPTDCPQRDERLGWMGDAQVFVRTATDNADIASFFTKWLVDVDDAQRPDGAFTDVSPWRGSGNGTPAWADAGVICPWTIYLAYGDKRILEQHLPAMTKWIEWCRTHSTDLIREKKSDRGSDYGDWLAIGADTPKDVIGTAYFAYSTHLVAKSYEALGNAEQAAKYNQLFNDIKTAFNKKYVSPDGRITGDVQSCYAMALKFELLPENLRPLAAQHLDDDIHAKHDHLSTGFVGVSYLLPTLTTAGKIDTAYTLLFQDSFPSWLFSVKQGATTMWERWDGWTPDKGFQSPGMNSFNHYSLGSCGEWLFDSVAGITWDEQHPGYKHILIQPHPTPSLTFANATIRSPYGPITSNWKLHDGKFMLHVSIPPNTTATLLLPRNHSTKTIHLDSGTYDFTSTP